ncbi:SAM-dependent methyltransferase [Caballeronia sp. LZ008]|uniref:SAM-dependent methyltransferase n=1 Tax=Caballeronia sp. LZ008 TaxID=3038560 RepID=UPI002855DBFC|nr:SAM-dependent methyltransferase [Caballeronia sp. LZ008]MDR5798021.1 SAM-dependent methyltransferase [Caballeronia sp. LZ008]
MGQGRNLQRRFDSLFQQQPDPWSYTTSWYERRKREVTLAVLPKQRYAYGFEPGCAIGVLTLGLAGRCEHLLSGDVSAVAVSMARARTAHLSNVQVELLEVPQQWPDGTFDLIVLSEFLCFVCDDGIREIASKAKAHLRRSGTVVACHWRYSMDPDEGERSGDHVHGVFDNALQLPRTVRHEEADFLLEVWTHDGRSVASLDNVCVLSSRT